MNEPILTITVQGTSEMKAMKACNVENPLNDFKFERAISGNTNAQIFKALYNTLLDNDSAKSEFESLFDIENYKDVDLSKNRTFLKDICLQFPNGSSILIGSIFLDSKREIPNWTQQKEIERVFIHFLHFFARQAQISNITVDENFPRMKIDPVFEKQILQENVESLKTINSETAEALGLPEDCGAIDKKQIQTIEEKLKPKLKNLVVEVGEGEINCQNVCDQMMSKSGEIAAQYDAAKTPKDKKDFLNKLMEIAFFRAILEFFGIRKAEIAKEKQEQSCCLPVEKACQNFKKGAQRIGTKLTKLVTSCVNGGSEEKYPPV